LNKENYSPLKLLFFQNQKCVQSQTNVLQEQLKTTLIEQKEFRICLLKAATKRQVDEVRQVNVLQEQIKSVETQDAPIVNEAKSIDVQIAKINDQIEKSKITNR
jgi:HlyD family secretion protein